MERERRRPSLSPEDVAREWHESLERLGPHFIWEDVPPWDKLPLDNRRLLVAVAQDLRAREVIR